MLGHFKTCNLGPPGSHRMFPLFPFHFLGARMPVTRKFFWGGLEPFEQEIIDLNSNELELIQTHKAQKPMLRVEEGARALRNQTGNLSADIGVISDKPPEAEVPPVYWEVLGLQLMSFLLDLTLPPQEFRLLAC